MQEVVAGINAILEIRRRHAKCLLCHVCSVGIAGRLVMLLIGDQSSAHPEDRKWIEF
jgi:hypothetical protein